MGEDYKGIFSMIPFKKYLLESIEKQNSIGEPIYQTEDGVKNFWKWFNRSKIVDSSGRPLVYYHYTTQDFDTFDINKGSGVAGVGIYLTNMKFSDDRYGDKVMELYVKCENPLDLSENDSKINEIAKKFGMVGLFEIRSIPQMREWSKDFRKNMIQNGFDGAFVAADGGRNGERHLVVYNPNQVKSIHNNGKFDLNTDNIMG